MAFEDSVFDMQEQRIEWTWIQKTINNRKTINVDKDVKNELDSNLPKGITYSTFIKWLLQNHEEIFIEIKEQYIPELKKMYGD